MIALSSGLSWLIFGGCIGIGALVYVAVVGRARFDEMERQARETWTFTEPVDPQVRIFGGVYDHEAREDFR